MGRRVEYPFGNAYTGIEGGNHIWREWIHRIGATDAGTEVVAMFDKHHVVDTLSRQEAELTGIEMDHMDDVSSVICSYGRSHWRETWRLESPWYPFVCQIDGAVFTLNRDNGRRWVNIESIPGCGPHVITFDGDKGQVAGLLPRPCFIFDDQEENVALVQEKGYRSGGVEEGDIVQGPRRHFEYPMTRCSGQRWFRSLWTCRSPTATQAPLNLTGAGPPHESDHGGAAE